MKKKVGTTLGLSTLTLLFTVSTAAAKTIPPIPLLAIKKDSPLYIKACTSATIKCNDDTRIWKTKDSDSTLYITDPTPILITLRKEEEKYHQDGLWDFSSLPHKRGNIDDDFERNSTYIYPALYPVSTDKQAVALVSSWSAAYSGGYRAKEYADFIMLNKDGSYKTIFKHVYFSLSEMIRACFSYEEQETKPHCHDEKWMTLKIKIEDNKSRYYSWKFIKSTYDYPSSSKKVSKHTKTTGPFTFAP